MNRTALVAHTGRVAPAPGTWVVLPGTSSVEISGRASRFAPAVHAAFSGVRGELLVDDEPGRSQVTIEIDLGTLSTGNPVYDDVLAHADPLQVSRHPVARFRSVEVLWMADDVRVTGTLELAGGTSVLTLSGRYRVDGSGIGVLSASGTVRTAVLGRFSMPGASLLVPRLMHLVVRTEVRHQV